MNRVELSLDLLEDQVQGLAIAESPADVFKALMEGARIAAPRIAIFLLKQSRLKGWGTFGYTAEASKQQRQFGGSMDDGWFADVLRAERSVVTAGPAANGYPVFGQLPADEQVGLAIRVKGRPIAVLVAERNNGESPWHPAVIGVLVRVAQLRLDLDLLRRKLGASAPTPVAVHTATEPSVVSPPSPSVALPTAQEPAPETVAESAAAAPAPVEKTATLEADPRLEAARRYARLVATDIRLYNEEAVAAGQRDGDLAIRLQESLMRGKETFVRRHGDLGPEGLQVLRDAYVEVLAGGKTDLIDAGAWS